MSYFSSLESLLDDHKKSLSAYSRILLGLSGGMDSTLLLHALVSSQPRSKITVIHCNHGLSAHADSWQDFCYRQCCQLGVPLVVERLNLTSNASEREARDARYRAFSSYTDANSVLLLGHHAQDQMETMLFRLFRGTGLKGLSSIPEQRSLPDNNGRLLRPLLKFRWSDLRDIAERNGLSWVEDESNRDNRFDRNYIRNKVLPVIEQRWPMASRHMSNLAVMLSEDDRALATYADNLIASLDLRPEPFGQSLSIVKLRQLEQPARERVIGQLCYKETAVLPNRDERRQILAQMLNSREDAQPLVIFRHLQFRRFRKRLYLLGSIAEPNLAGVPERWDGAEELIIPGIGRLQMLSNSSNPDFRIGFRGRIQEQSPMKLRSKSIKKLMNEHGIEPWLRFCLPLVYCDDRLIAIADRACFDSSFKFAMHWESQLTFD